MRVRLERWQLRKTQASGNRGAQSVTHALLASPAPVATVWPSNEARVGMESDLTAASESRYGSTEQVHDRGGATRIIVRDRFGAPEPRFGGPSWAALGQAVALPSPREGDGTCPHQPVRRGEEYVQVVEVLPDPAVTGLGEPEVAFDDQERVLDLGAHRRLA